MKELSKGNQAIIEAYNRGYNVSKDGINLLNINNKIIKTSISNVGYKRYTIKYQEDSVSILIHRLQAYQKYGNKIFEDGIVVRHLDGNPTNNSWDNIAIGTQKDNVLDIPKEIRLNNALIATSKVKIHDHKAILEDRANGMTYKELMKKYEISSKGTLSFIINKSYDKE